VYPPAFPFWFRLAENVHYTAWEHNAQVAFLHGADILFPLEFCIHFWAVTI
jgi:hypothetical protein